MAHWTPELVLLYALHLLVTTLGVTAQYPSRPRAPGVAFRLTPDYVAIYFKDGTSVPVAQIQGSPRYQIFMRKDTVSMSAENSILCRLLSPALHSLPPAFGLAVDICRHPDVTSIKTLLATLKTTVESYLGTTICFAALSLDDVEGHEVGVAQEALQALGLRQVLPTIRAAKSMVLAHMPNTLPGSDEEPWVVLAVDYSFRWFNVGLYTVDDISIVDPIQGTVRRPRIGEDNQLNALKEALRHLLANPPPDVNLPKQIHHLVVYSNDAKNDNLHHLLAKVLGADLIRDAHISSSIYDGVTILAHSAHEQMDTIDFETRAQPAFGCRWRSRLYRKDHREL